MGTAAKEAAQVFLARCKFAALFFCDTGKLSFCSSHTVTAVRLLAVVQADGHDRGFFKRLRRIGAGSAYLPRIASEEEYDAGLVLRQAGVDLSRRLWVRRLGDEHEHIGTGV